MFIPIGDEPNPKTTPYVTYALIALNVYVWLIICRPAFDIGVQPFDPEVLRYLATMRRATGLPTRVLLQDTSAYDILTFTYGFRPSSPSLVALFTSLFLHGSWSHLIGNMLFLWIFGDNIEARVGGKTYVILYLAGGVIATLFYALFKWDSALPLIGASGAISAILGAYFIWFGHHRVRILMVLLIFIQIIYVPARWVLGFYLLIENLLPFMLQSAPTSTTAYGAHIGGFFAGSAFALAWNNHAATGKYGTPKEWLHAVRRAPWAGSASAGADAAQDVTADVVAAAIAQGRFDEAWAGYTALDDQERQKLAAPACFTLADVTTQRGNLAMAAALLQRYLADHPHANNLDLARGHLRLGLLQLRGMNKPIPAREHLLTVMDLEPKSPEAQAAADALRSMG